MRREQSNIRRPRLWAARTALALGSLCLIAPLSPVFGGGEERKDDPSSFAAGDETVGTLPIQQVGAMLDLRRDLRIFEPSLAFEGELSDIQNALVSVGGQAVAQVENVGYGTGRVRVIFPRNVQLAFDRLMIESSSIRVGVWVPGNLRTVPLHAVWSSRSATFGTRDVGTATSFIELPILALSGTGALSYAPFLAQAQGTTSPTFVSAVTNADFLVLRQSH